MPDSIVIRKDHAHRFLLTHLRLRPADYESAGLACQRVGRHGQLLVALEKRWALDLAGEAGEQSGAFSGEFFIWLVALSIAGQVRP